jgi:hypothetical protein
MAIVRSSSGIEFHYDSRPAPNEKRLAPPCRLTSAPDSLTTQPGRSLTDDFRIASVSPDDPIRYQRSGDSRSRKNKKPPGGENAEIEDVVSFSEQSDGEEEPGAGYSPHSGDGKQG